MLSPDGVAFNMPNEIPPNYSDSGLTIYSNANHALNISAVQQLMTEPVFAHHPAWEHYGFVWYEPEAQLWHEVVKRHRVVVGHYTGPTAEDVIQQANAWGTD